MPRKSGAQNRKAKIEKLRLESAERPGQLKISQIFKGKCVDKIINNNDSTFSIEKAEEQCSESCLVETIDVQENPTSLNVFEPLTLSECETNNTCNVLETQVLVHNSLIEVPLNETNDNSVVLQSSSSETCIETTSHLNEAQLIVALASNEAPQCEESGANVSQLLFNRRLSPSWLVENYEFLILTKKNENGKLRPFIHCTICRDFEAVAKAHSKNGSVPLSIRVRVDNQEKLQRVVSHLEGKSHEEAAKAKIKHDLCNSRSESHVWRKFLNDENDENSLMTRITTIVRESKRRVSIFARRIAGISAA